MIPTEVAILADYLALLDGRGERDDEDIETAFKMLDYMAREHGYYLMKPRITEPGLGD